MVFPMIETSNLNWIILCLVAYKFFPRAMLKKNDFLIICHFFYILPPLFSLGSEVTYLIRLSIIKITSAIFFQAITRSKSSFRAWSVSLSSTYIETSNLFQLFRLDFRKLINDLHFKLKRRDSRTKFVVKNKLLERLLQRKTIGTRTCLRE